MNAGIWPILVGLALVGLAAYKRHFNPDPSGVGHAILALVGLGIVAVGVLIVVLA